VYEVRLVFVWWVDEVCDDFVGEMVFGYFDF